MRNEFAKCEIKTSVFSGRKPQAGNCWEVANRGGTRPTRAHRRAARCRTLARSEKRPRVRAKAVRNHVSLCFSSVSRAPGPSMSPLIMSHINRTRPRQGLELVIRRVAGSQISHIFRRASAGSEALPSLARRVSMQQHAELTCRGNKNGWQKLDQPQPGQVHPRLIGPAAVGARRSSGEPTWRRSLLGCRRAPGPCRSRS